MSKRKIKMEVISFYIDNIVNVEIVGIENILNLQIFRKLSKERFVHKKKGGAILHPLVVSFPKIQVLSV